METIKKLGFEDYGKLAIVFSEEEIKRWGLREKDVIDLSDIFIIQGGKND